MGTSKSFSTPSGGAWTGVKNDITSHIGGNASVPASQVLGRAVAAAGLSSPFTGSRSPGGSGSGGGAGGGGGRGGRQGRRTVGKALAGLGGFGTTLRDQGLDHALETLGLQELSGRSAVEVVAKIAEHLAGEADGLQSELLTTALREAILDAAALEDDRSYQNLEASLQSFLNREGVEGLVVLFLTRYVFDRVWLFIENHVDLKSDSTTKSETMATAVEHACRGHVEQYVEDSKADGRFNQTNWFGRGGQAFGQQIVNELESRLAALAPGDFG